MMQRGIALSGRGRSDEPEWPVLLAVGAALLIGALIAVLASGGSTTVRRDDLTVAYPAGWVQADEPGAAIAAVDYERGGVFGPRISVRRLLKEELAASPDVAVGDAAAAWVLRRAEALTAYRVVDLEPVRVRGRDGIRIEYAYVENGPSGATAGSLPGVMRAADTIVDAGNSYAVLTLASENGDWGRLSGWRFPRLRSVEAEILRSWRF